MLDSDENPSHANHDYDDFLRRKVELALRQIAHGQYRSNDEVEAHFAARREKLRREAH